MWISLPPSPAVARQNPTILVRSFGSSARGQHSDSRPSSQGTMRSNNHYSNGESRQTPKYKRNGWEKVYKNKKATRGGPEVDQFSDPNLPGTQRSNLQRRRGGPAGKQWVPVEQAPRPLLGTSIEQPLPTPSPLVNLSQVATSVAPVHSSVKGACTDNIEVDRSMEWSPTKPQAHGEEIQSRGPTTIQIESLLGGQQNASIHLPHPLVVNMPCIGQDGECPTTVLLLSVSKRSSRAPAGREEIASQPIPTIEAHINSLTAIPVIIPSEQAPRLEDNAPAISCLTVSPD
uniref:Uncharacterized protein n=1 Tax=Physcomitrium patens TaxID=3218 RepID=A9S9H4_PHYPA|nr:hypothetical protein PHYPA_013629 [Physcomitrium patens]